jgi:Helix-turn-helix domain
VRVETDVDGSGGFAAELRRLHREAGKPTYRELQRRTGYGRTVLSAALNGSRLPTWPVAEALVTALGGDPAAVKSRWAAAAPPAPAAEAPGSPTPRRWRRWAFAAAAAAVLIAAVTVFVVLREASQSPTAQPGDATAPAIGIRGTCMTVTAQDVRVFTSANGDEPWTRWTHGTKFWVDRDAGSPHRYRTVLRDGRHGWVTNDKHYVQPASGCP